MTITINNKDYSCIHTLELKAMSIPLWSNLPIGFSSLNGVGAVSLIQQYCTSGLMWGRILSSHQAYHPFDGSGKNEHEFLQLRKNKEK
jgi:hypothetical protein